MAATMRIITAVGWKPDDAEALARDIAKALTEFEEITAVARTRKKGSRKLLTKTRKLLEQTSKKIANDPLMRTTAEELEKITAGLRNYEQWHKMMDRYPTKHGQTKEWLCG